MDENPLPLLIADVRRPDGTGTVETIDLTIVDGLIHEIGRDLQLPAGARRIDGRGALILPGLVNAHSHSYGTLCRHDGAGLALEPWMNYALAGTIGRTDEEIEIATLLHSIEALRTGTTALVDHIGGPVAGLGTVLGAYERVGIRARVAPMISDIALPASVGIPAADWPEGSGRDAAAFSSPATAAELVDETLALRDRAGASGRVEVIFGPSAPQRCSSDLLRRIAVASAEHGVPVHTHLLETRRQAALSRTEGGDAVARLVEAGLMNSRLSAAHGVWLERDELAVLADAGALLVHNPHSNLQLGSGIAEVSLWTAEGVQWALGTDSVNCGGSMDMLGSLRLASLLPRPALRDSTAWPTPSSLLPHATETASGTLGLPASRIAPGEPADLALFSTDTAPFATGADPLATLVLGAWDHSARTVIVDGRIVVDEGVLTTIDEGAVISAAREASERLRERNGGLRRIADAQRDTLRSAAAASRFPRAVLPPR